MTDEMAVKLCGAGQNWPAIKCARLDGSVNYADVVPLVGTVNTSRAFGKPPYWWFIRCASQTDEALILELEETNGMDFTGMPALADWSAIASATLVTDLEVGRPSR